jgi:hypothetical protein
MANLSPEQTKQVESWAEAGATLNDIQSRLKAEFDILLTYLDARMLLIDIGVRLKEKAKPVPSPVAPPESAAAVPPAAEDWTAAVPAGGGVHVTSDPAPVAGAIASGGVTFSDGKSASWFVDQNGRLGLKAPDPAYEPPLGDIPSFEQQLDALLQGL